MPYELSFTKRVEIADPDGYINECCIGGDVVSAALLPALEARCGDIDSACPEVRVETCGVFMEV